MHISHLFEPSSLLFKQVQSTNHNHHQQHPFSRRPKSKSSCSAGHDDSRSNRGINEWLISIVLQIILITILFYFSFDTPPSFLEDSDWLPQFLPSSSSLPIVEAKTWSSTTRTFVSSSSSTTRIHDFHRSHSGVASFISLPHSHKCHNREQHYKNDHHRKSSFVSLPTTLQISPKLASSSSSLSLSGINRTMDTTAAKKLVLIGGGHAHLQVIKSLSKRNRKKLQVTLVDVQTHASYSGMVPGCVSQLYTKGETMIDLEALANWSDVLFLNQAVVDIDVPSSSDETGKKKKKKKKEVILSDGSRVEFDVISFDIGSTSRGLDGIGGVREYTIPTRPISDLVDLISDAEQQLLLQQQQQKETESDVKRDEEKNCNVKVIVIGGGAAGIELAFAMRARWNPVFSKDNNDNDLSVTLLDAGSELLPNETKQCRLALNEALAQRNIHVRHGCKVEKVTPTSIHLKSSNNNPKDDTTMEVLYTHCIWAAGASAHSLSHKLQSSCGIDIDENGWIRVTPTLQSKSHPYIFAAGDCARIDGLYFMDDDGQEKEKRSPPKAGVYAVRSGPILIENLTKYLLSSSPPSSSIIETESTTTSLVKYNPQDDFLKLFMCGDGTALGFRFGLPLQGKWVWELKDKIDSMFMDLFRVENLPPPPLARNNDDDDDEDFDTSQYDASIERPPPLSPEEAGRLLMRTDDDVDFQRAWDVLKDMMADELYKDQVVEVATACLLGKEEEGRILLELCDD